LDLDRWLRAVWGPRIHARATHGGERHDEAEDRLVHPGGLRAAGYVAIRASRHLPATDQPTPTGGAARRWPSRTGRQNETRVPPPGSGSAHITPPCSLTICRARWSPTPAPGLSLPSVCSPAENG